MLPPEGERAKLRQTLDRLAGSVEELLLGGLTTASESTRQAVDLAMQEAARSRLLRLGATLRVVAEELGRFHRQDPLFSRRRLTFFLNRAWLLARGLGHALGSADGAEFDRLNFTPPTRPVPSLEVVCLGAVKKVAAGAFVAFDFRLRALAAAGPVAEGQRLTWSTVFPVKPGAAIPAEGFLHLPQKQKFNASLFLERARLTLTDVAVADDGAGGARVSLTETSRVTAGSKFTDWGRFLAWSPAPAAERLARHRPGPLDLDTELQEEVVLTDYGIGSPAEGDEPGQTVYQLAAGPLLFHAPVGGGEEGQALRKSLDALRKPRADRRPLFGLLHYERCRLVLQPLTVFREDGPDYLTISKEVVNKAALLKAMNFT